MEEIMLPGFRFHPTDEELVGFYLKKKVQQRPVSVEVIIPLDIYKHDPWDLPKLATTGEKEWYFYCPRDRKYRNSARPNRVTGSGFWKATGTDRPIYSSDGSRCIIGLKKSLVFYRGRAAKGFKTDWMMHEFRLPSAADHNGRAKRLLEKTIPPNELWAICRIFKKASSSAQTALSHSWVTPILETSPSPIIPHYDKDFCHFDHKPFNIDQSTPILTNNNKTSPSSISSNQDTNHLISVHEPDLSTAIEASSLLFNLQPSILEDFGDEGLDYMTNGDQQYFYDSCSPIASIPTLLQEKLGYGDQHQQLSIDLMFQIPTDCVYFENQWDNNCFV